MDWGRDIRPSIGRAAFLATLLMAAGTGGGGAQQAQGGSGEGSGSTTGAAQSDSTDAAALLQTPITRIFPGDVPIQPGLKNPAADDPDSLERGMSYFLSFNCVGCHADNGGGGMGPSLSNSTYIYGSDPANIYLSIWQGRPNGMPAWSGMLPEQAIWDLVNYVQSLSKEPGSGWGKTISRNAFTVEQVPAEKKESATPWDYTQPFKGGQKP